MTPRHRRIAGCLAAVAALAPVALAAAGPAVKGPEKNLNACDGGVKIEPVRDGTYPRTLNGVPLSITLDVDEAAQSIGFAIGGGEITGVRVKGGPSAAGVLYDYAGGATAGDGLTAPDNPNSGRVYGLSHVCFFSDPDDSPPPVLLTPPTTEVPPPTTEEPPPATQEPPPATEEQPGDPAPEPPLDVLSF